MRTIKFTLGMVFVIALLTLQSVGCFAIGVEEMPVVTSVQECALVQDADKIFGDISFLAHSDSVNPIEARVLLGIYDRDGTLAGLEQKNQQLSNGDNILVFSQVEVPVKKQTSHAARLFVWDKSSMKPQAAEKKMEIPKGKSVQLDLYKFYAWADQTLTFYEAYTSSNKVSYSLSKDVKFFVNGVVIPAEQIGDYLTGDLPGTVTLLDYTGMNSDGLYDKVLITHYKTGMIDNIIVTEGAAKINWRVVDPQMDSVLELNAAKQDIQIFLGDQKISLDQLQSNDVLSIQYDVTGDLRNSRFYKIFASRDQVEGTVTSFSKWTDNILVFTLNNGKRYISAFDDALEIGTTCRLYLDVFGRYVMWNELVNSKNYAIIDRIYRDVQTQEWKVRLVNSAGSMINYTVRNPADIGEELVDFNVNKDVPVKDRLATYKLNSKNEIYDIQIVIGNSLENAEYKVSTNKIGPYLLAENVVMIDASRAVAKGTHYTSSDYKAVTPASLEDGKLYSIVAYDKRNDSAYRFVVITKNTNVPSVYTPIAVVHSVEHEENPYDNISYPVLYVYTADSEDLQKVFVDESKVRIDGYKNITDIPKGTAIVYSVNANGVTDTLNLVMPASLGLDESVRGLDLYRYTADLAAGDDASNYFLSDSDKSVNWYLKTGIQSWNDSNSATYEGKARVVFGPVTEKNMRVISIAAVTKEGTDYISTEDQRTENNYSVSSSVNVYIYDYARRLSDRLRKGTFDEVTKTFIPKEIWEGVDHTVTWNTAIGNGDITPYYAMLKIVDEEVTDMLFIISNDSNEVLM